LEEKKVLKKTVVEPYDRFLIKHSCPFGAPRIMKISYSSFPLPSGERVVG
jgi:hypothetical protein